MSVVALLALGWAIYHAGIEQGRKRAARQGQPSPSVITRLREWHR